jgi:hypothetical protein
MRGLPSHQLHTSRKSETVCGGAGVRSVAGAALGARPQRLHGAEYRVTNLSIESAARAAPHRKEAGMRVFQRLLTLTVASTAAFVLLTANALAGGVLPANARPHGWSLERMTSATALFTTSGNQTAY